ncbi:YbaB/EbfC family nucleoid-associated protein [Kitasatospora aureofaciens]|uniref:YbaB/EbfC family nucleoid-associated protein n=1 Tax=Kitasatospora aureofaciens TaxID=1894 RepID=UPI001C48FAD2|nr:YbaB/EbfC family nucleoid-associated protein [Kitasatospora aureofaciens]MBV6699317.1 YbaB/EbfC family nucleoid-associated protein [Kitasatospora aureofaciens]
MSYSFEEQLNQAMASLAEQQERLAESTRKMRAMTASATSKDRMVTAKVGSQGELLALTFHTTAYQSMAPAQLGTVLKDVLNEAKARMGDQITAEMRTFEGVGESLRMNFTGERGDEELFGAGGGLDLDALLAPLTAMRPGADQAPKSSRKQEEFNG